jgi:L-asparaginase/Glu-tRNA(Gln) amidotransferase subunit D
MSHFHSVRFAKALLACAILLSSYAGAADKLAHVTILATGGTIAGSGATSTTGFLLFTTRSRK